MPKPQLSLQPFSDPLKDSERAFPDAESGEFSKRVHVGFRERSEPNEYVASAGVREAIGKSDGRFAVTEVTLVVGADFSKLQNALQTGGFSEISEAANELMNLSGDQITGEQQEAVLGAVGEAIMAQLNGVEK